MYVGHLGVYRRTLIEDVGGFVEFDDLRTTILHSAFAQERERSYTFRKSFITGAWFPARPLAEARARRGELTSPRWPMRSRSSLVGG